jgi:ankyrin repeat protein
MPNSPAGQLKFDTPTLQTYPTAPAAGLPQGVSLIPRPFHQNRELPDTGSFSPRVTTSKTSTLSKRKREVEEDDRLSSESNVVEKRSKIDNLGKNGQQNTFEDEEEVKAVAHEKQQTLTTITTGTNNKELSDRMHQIYVHARNEAYNDFKGSLDYEIVKLADTNGNTLLHNLMSAYCSVKFIDALTSMGADVNAVNKAGDTPLHYAARKHRGLFVNKLLRSGANRNIQNKEGKTPYDVASNFKTKELLSRPEKEG